MELIYHYTNLTHIEEIFEDGFLRPSVADKAFGIKPAIWFSKNTHWEPTATKMVLKEIEFVDLTEEEQFTNLGMIRFGIPFSKLLISWRKYLYVGKIHPQLHSMLEKIGQEKGAKPGDWYCSFNKVPLAECICIEQFDGSNWLSILEEEVDENHPSVINP